MLTTTITASAPQSISVDVLLEKYAKGDERDADAIFQRVAKAMASVEKPELRLHWEAEFLANLRRGAIGAGRIMSAAGTAINSTLINCFVQPVGDAISGVDDDGIPGIYEALREAAETMRRGGGVGYNFSRIRPKNAWVRSTQSMASGPCSYMDVFNASCSTVESAGSRRGAQMGVLNVQHPDIYAFIQAKRTKGRWNGFNVSVGVTDEFLRALERGEDVQLVHKAAPAPHLIAAGAFQRQDGLWVYETVPAQSIWDTMMQSAYDFAEPGIIFIDVVNRENNLRFVEIIEATNPCGEQPLPSYGCCDLGPIILPRFVRNPFGIGGEATFDFEAFAAATKIQGRFLDNVLDQTEWPLEQQRKEAQAKRRIGIGYTGLGNALTMLKLRYSSDEGRAMAARITEVMRDTAYDGSVDLAIEKGAFPLLDVEKYLSEGTFASRLPERIKARIREHGIRNSHLISIAPTGTVSLAFADNASNGIEPAFSWSYTRTKREADGSKRDYVVEDHALRVYRELGGDTSDLSKLPDYFVNAMQMSAADHIGVMQAVQPFVDTAISKTVNVPVDMPYADFKDMYLQAWRAGLKGLATYRPNDTLGSVLSTTPATAPVAPPAPAAVDPLRVAIDRRPEGALPSVSEKVVYWNSEGKQGVYLTVSFMQVTLPDGKVVERPIEFFMPVGQNSQSQQWISSSMRLLSLAARGGMVEKALRDMRKVAWDRGPVRLGEVVRESDGAKMPMWHDSEVAAIAYAVQEIIKNRAAVQPYGAGPRVLPTPAPAAPVPKDINRNIILPGKKCAQCGAHAVIKKDGCDYCTACGDIGACG